MAETALPGVDLAALVAGLGAALRAAGLPVGPDRCARFARAVAVARPDTPDRLRWCARATLAADPAQVDLLDRVLDTLPEMAGASRAFREPRAGRLDQDAERVAVPFLASPAERLAGRDFATLTADELASLAEAMRRLTLATPPRRARRTRPVSYGHRVDLRATLRRAHRTGGDPRDLVLRRRVERRRRLVVLCDISGSMAPYSRAMLQLLYCAAGGAGAEVFTFATRLTRLTPALAGGRPSTVLERAARTAPDWSGGTRIGAALREFIDQYGRPGLARGAVILVVSDGWDTGEPAELGRQMGRLSRLAYRIVWANPRTQSPRYQPLAGGMAAAWPHCDAVVSAHSLAALPDLVAALADPVRRRRLES
jgi:uncharacterized protein